MSGSDSDDYGPSLPPSLAQQRSTAPKGATLGPQLPPHLQNREQHESSDEEDVGPLPATSAQAATSTDGVAAFIEREQRLKDKAKVEAEAGPSKLKREEWMLVPPKESDLLKSMDPTKLKSRTFSTAPDASTKRKQDTASTLWTETPEERSQRILDEQSGKRRKIENTSTANAEEEEEARRKQMRDQQLRETVDAHNRKKRDKTLYTDHNEKRAQRSKEPAADDGKAPVIWDRDAMLGHGGQILSDKKRREMIKKAQGADGLNSRFGSSGFA